MSAQSPSPQRGDNNHSDSLGGAVIARCRDFIDRPLPDSFSDLSAPDRVKLQHIITVARQLPEIPEIRDLLDSLSLDGHDHEPLLDPALILLSPPHLERIDRLSDSELEKYTHFPNSPEEALAQTPFTLPVSGDPELYSGLNIRRFFERVSERVGDVDLQLHIVRHDVASCSGVVHRNQPIHTITTFRHNGELMGGPFCGSTTQYILRFCESLPREGRSVAVENFLRPLVEKFSTFTIAFAVPQKFNTASQEYELSHFPLNTSQTFELLSGEALGFNVFQPARLFDGSSGNNIMNHLYYFRGDQQVLEDDGFRRTLQAIREARRELRVESRASEGFFEVEAKRNRLRAEYIAKLIC